MNAKDSKKDWFKKTISAVMIFGMASIACADEATVENTNTQFEQGVAILETATTSADLFQAKGLIISAANAGNPRAQLFMGLLTAKDSESASLPWFQKAADQKHPTAMVELGKYYEDGKGR